MLDVTARGSHADPRLSTIMQAYLDGDFTALGRLYRILAPRVRRTVQGRIHDADLVEDVVQQTFVRAHFGRQGFRARATDAAAGKPMVLSDEAVVAWYLAIARNTAIDGVRSEQRHRRGRVGVDDDTTPLSPVDARNPVEDPEQSRIADESRAETRARVRAAIFELPASQRDVVVMHKLRGMPMQAVAEQLHVRPGAARVRAHRAYASLAKRLAA
jgi:RNA polymerase sigma-70 factor (ECF subfamily)